MELLLNLVWLLLALPAFWLWRHGVSESERKYSSLHCLLALGCILVLLFPVISATDDLHAMRAEIEEPGISKRAVRQAAADRSSIANRSWHIPPAMAARIFSAIPSVTSRFKVHPVKFVTAGRTPIRTSSRAPPSFCLA